MANDSKSGSSSSGPGSSRSSGSGGMSDEEYRRELAYDTRNFGSPEGCAFNAELSLRTNGAEPRRR